MGDGRLKALYAVQAGMNAREIQKNQKTDKAINKNNAVGINISLGSNGWKDHAETITEETRGSTVTAGRTAVVIAKEDMTVKGSTVNAKDIHLKTGNNIHILSSENKSTTTEETKGKSGSIGAFLSKGGYGIGASYGKGKGQTEETTLTHTPSDITAKNTVALSGGNDTTIKGGIIKGNKVTADIGRNLSIESEQDKKNYKETSKTSGLSISYTPGSAVTVSGGKGKTNTDSTYESVTKQAGIYAGKEGYDIQVKNNTRLKGAVIDSQAEKEKNRITTGTLTWENIDNKAEYKTGGHGISYSGKIGRGDKNDPLDSRTNNRYGKDSVTGQRNGMNKITPTIYGSKIPLNERGLLNTPIPSVKGKAGTTTTSAIAKGTITITDKENQKQDIEKLNRNTEDSLNKLKEIFDKTKVEERKQLLEELGIVGNRAIHEIASHNGWKDGSAEKIALHGMLGAITSAKSGGSALSGLIAGGVNEYAIEYLKQTKGKDWIAKHPDIVQNISAAFGGILSKMTGGSGHTGAYISQMGTKWNEYLLTQLERSEEELWEQKEKEREQYPGNGAYSKEEIEDAIEKGVIKEKDYFMNLANAYPGGAGIALEMSAMSDYEIQQKYGNQMTLIEGRTYVINQKSPFADTIMHSINYTNALGDAISRVRASGIRDQYVDFTVDIRSDSKTNEIFDNSSFLLAGTYSGNISVMIDSKGVIHERSCFIDNYNFERHKLPNSYGFGKIMELNNAAALSMQAGKLKPFMWILYVHRTFSRFGESNEE